jgi:hypothetical protein
VFEPELEHILKDSGGRPDQITVDWLPLRAHDQPEVLRTDLQKLINAAGDTDAVVLAYGLCGNAAAGLRAGPVPLYIPRAHDCSHILLGSTGTHRKYFGENPSRGWTSRGYLQSEDNPFREGETSIGWDMDMLIEQYGEENARYVWDTLHASDSSADPVLYFLDVPETSAAAVIRRAADKAALRGKTLEVVPATLDLLIRLLGGRGGDGILKVPPGAAITPSWDDSVMRTEMESTA